MEERIKALEEKVAVLSDFTKSIIEIFERVGIRANDANQTIFNL